MTQDLIGYAKLTQNALRAVVRDALKMSINGLPGDHHFYISFKTRAKGVQVANYLVEKYPEEMTIVLQLQFEGLEVHDDKFAVTLHFGGVPQRIVIPYAAITRFYDPHARFALPFDVVDDYGAEEVETEADAIEAEIEPTIATEKPADGAAAVVSLDAFRRKK